MWNDTDTVLNRSVHTKVFPLQSDTYRAVVDASSAVILTLSLLAVICNAIGLYCSRWATGGVFSTLVYFRSLCILDLVFGLSGLLKFGFIQSAPRWVNCFLPDSCLVFALIGQLFVLALAFYDSCRNLSSHLGKDRHIDKYTSIFAVIVTLCVSVTVAFLPQMGVNDQYYSCQFFVYQNVIYLGFIVAVFCVSAVVMAFSFKSAKHYSAKCRDLYQVNLVRLKEVSRLTLVVHNTAIDAVCLVVAALPLVIYILVHVSSRVSASRDAVDVYLLLPWCVLLVKAVTTAVVRCVRTVEIYNVCRTFKHYLLCRRLSQSSSSSVESTRYEDSDRVFSVDGTLQRDRAHAQESAQHLHSLNATELASVTSSSCQVATERCIRCGYQAVTSLHRKDRRAYSIGSLPYARHPLQVVYGAKKWQNFQLRRFSQVSMPSSGCTDTPLRARDSRALSCDASMPHARRSVTKRSLSFTLPLQMSHHSNSSDVNRRQRSDSTGYASASDSSHSKAPSLRGDTDYVASEFHDVTHCGEVSKNDGTTENQGVVNEAFQS